MSAAEAGAATTAPAHSPADERNQREKILRTALQLMGEQGAAMTSMRQLAAACDLNVATLYHYFASKAEILKSVIEDRGYVEALRDEGLDVDPSLAPPDRLAALLRTIFTGAVDEEEPIWRLLLGEALRNEQVALDEVQMLSDALEEALARTLDEHFPEFEGDTGAAAVVLRAQVFAFCIETLPLRNSELDRHIKERALETAALFFPG